MNTLKTAATGLATLALVAVTGAASAAPLFEGAYDGLSDDTEPVTVVTKRKDDGKLYVTKFRVDQGVECGVTNYTHSTAPDVMPVQVKKKDDGTRYFKIVDDETVPGVIVFKVKGRFQTSDYIVGSYSQIACDGQTDTYWVEGIQ